MTKAKNFTLEDKDGNKHELYKIPAKYIVLYFYPKDSTPGCTIEAHEFTKHKTEFEKLGATIIGISGGSNTSKQKFCEDEKLSILLLTDPDFSVAKAYDSYGDKQFMGRTYQGIMRNTFILDKDKNIINEYQNVKPATHAKEILEFLSGK